MNVFNEIDRFFSSLYGYLTLNESFLIFVGIFLFVIIVTIISTSNAYEVKLIKAVDMFNNYFINNPQITEENLVPFNNKMKSRKVPKQLRKQWQQFVLYREHPASHYMSFEICVSSPLKNSTFKRDITTMNIISYILAILSFLFNLYSIMVVDLVSVLQQTLLCPIFILVLNYIVTIFLDLRHNAVVSDLHQNYQYFEVNMDKATQTLPDYVDYEVLFDKNEIRKGIPILYSYLQRRAEEEKKELERARLRNVEHEKFNFDEAGVESSLVLERAMQEAESYIAERKKYMQDMEQINNDISQEELSFRETTKEYQRQMQVSKESFENFKAQLDEASSAIEANYLKKQQQQELDRQRNLERDYDTATDRHKKILENYQEELTAIENEIKEVRTKLEKGMMSEFNTYSDKVFDAAIKQAEASHNKKVKTLEDRVSQLENALQNNGITPPQPEPTEEELEALNKENEEDSITREMSERYDKVVNQTANTNNEQNVPNVSNKNFSNQPVYNNYPAEPAMTQPSEDASTANVHIEPVTQAGNAVEQGFTFNYLDDEPTETTNQVESYNGPIEEGENSVGQEPFVTVQNESTTPKKRPGRPRKEKVVKPSRPVGRPKKVKTEETTTEPRRPGRPRKTESAQVSTPKKKPGRPRKVVGPATQTNDTPTETKPKKKAGRPKKNAEEKVIPTSEPKRRGRPKKISGNTETEASNKTINATPNSVANDATVTAPTANTEEDLENFLKELDAQIAEENAKIAETTKELEKKSRISRRTPKE